MGVAGGVGHEHSGCGIGRKAADKVDDAWAGEPPIDSAVGFEDFGCQGHGLILLLGLRGECATGKAVESLDDECTANLSQTVVEVFGGVVGGDGGGLLHEDGAFVDALVEHEGGDTGKGFAIDDSPVDGCGTPVAGKQGGMQVEGTHRRHAPYALGQHAEGHDNKDVGIPLAKAVEEERVAQFFGLEEGKAVGKGIFFDWRGGEFESAPCGTVGDGDDTYHLVACLADCLKGGNGKVGGAHEYDSHLMCGIFRQ